MFAINPEIYLRNSAVDVFSSVSQHAKNMNKLRRLMLEDGFGDHGSDFDADISACVSQLQSVDYSEGFSGFVLDVIDAIVFDLKNDQSFQEKLQACSMDNVEQIKDLLLHAQKIIEARLSQTEFFKLFTFDNNLLFVNNDLSGANRELASCLCVVEDVSFEGVGMKFTIGHDIEINLHETALKYQGSVARILSSLIHENMHAIENMVWLYWQNIDRCSGEHDYAVSAGKLIFYPDRDMRKYAPLLYREHPSERFARAGQNRFFARF